MQVETILLTIKIYSFKSALNVEVLDADFFAGQTADKIDHFSFRLSTSLNKFNSSTSLTVQGQYGIGKLTLSYGNLTTDTTSCQTIDSPTSPTSTYRQEGIYIRYAQQVYTRNTQKHM